MLPRKIKLSSSSLSRLNVTLMRRHSIAEAAALLALASELVAVCLGQVGAVVEHVIAGVGGCGGHPLHRPQLLGQLSLT